MELKEFIAELATKAGVEGLEPDEEGAYNLLIDGMQVSFRETPEGGSAYFFATVGDLPTAAGEAFYRMLLEAMYLGRGTGEASLSIDGERKLVCLHRIVILEGLDHAGFSKALEAFVNTLEVWGKTVADYRELAPALAEAAQAATDESRQLGMGLGGMMQV